MGPKMDLVKLLCEPDVSGNKEDAGPPVFLWTCCESLSYCHRRSEGGTTTIGLREALSQEVRGRHCHRRSEGGNMMEVAGSHEVHRVHSRSARRPDMSGSHSWSISDPTRSS